MNYGVGLNIAYLYNKQGDYDQAIEYLKKVDPPLDDRWTLNMLADAYYGQGEYLKAIKIYKQALEEWEKRSASHEIIGNLISLGEIYSILGDTSQARDCFQKSLKLGEVLNVDSLMPKVLLANARFELTEGEYAKALEMSKRAQTYFEKLSAIGVDWKLYATLGKAYQGLGQIDKARQNFEKAIIVIENLRTQVAGSEEEQQRFFQDKISAYDLMIDLLISQNKPDEAFTFAERAKSRVLLDVLQNGKMDINKALTLPEQKQEHRLKNELISYNAQISIEKQREKPDEARLSELHQLLDQKRLELEDFQTRLYAAHPELKIQRGEIKLNRFAETVSLLSGTQDALLEYTVSAEKTYLFVLTKDIAQKMTLKVYPIEVREKDLSKGIESYRSKLEKGDLGFQKQSRELFDLLLKPAQLQLAGKTNLIIVPDGALWDLPFQALENDRNRYLIEQTALSYTPSLSALHELRKKSKRINPDSKLELLAFGNPVVAKETSDRIKQVWMSEALEPLPESERLVKELGRIYGVNRSKVFIGDQAREETAKTESPKYRIIQFATHGILNNISPMYSHLVLAQNDKNQNEDGMLEAWEMKELDLKAEMVILSACETARGRISNGEGVIGMSWVMFIAGAPTTVASQWKVESSSTTELMLEFHRQLLAGKGISKAEALRRASLKLLKMPNFKHPSYWAGFVIVGDGF